MDITFKLNGENVTFETRPSQTLLSLLRENGYFVVVDAKGKKIIFTPAQVDAVRNKPRAKLAEAKPESEATEAKPKRSYKPRAKKA